MRWFCLPDRLFRNISRIMDRWHRLLKSSIIINVILTPVINSFWCDVRSRRLFAIESLPNWCPFKFKCKSNAQIRNSNLAAIIPYVVFVFDCCFRSFQFIIRGLSFSFNWQNQRWSIGKESFMFLNSTSWCWKYQIDGDQYNYFGIAWSCWLESK